MTRYNFVPFVAVFLLAFAIGLPASAADTYKIDPDHTVVLFKVNHLGFSDFYGRFNEASGSFTIDEENPANNSVTFEIKAESVDTHSDRRDQHLRGPDFLSAKQFPVIRFKSNRVKKTGDMYRVTGDLSLRGVTKPLTVTLERQSTGKDPWGNVRTGFNGSFTVKRSDFGVSYMPEGLGENVEIVLAIEGLKQ